ncbi:MAG: helix-turn-helix transcriptional regulator [Bacteroidetes bacterium]|nr:helix-turn-helix transcriptional regulator [Bacteroidota bacterium]
MLKLDIDKHCRARNLPNTAAYLRQNGISHWVSHQLANNQKLSIGFYDLEQLCVIFKCTPDDLFEWIPDTAEEEKNTRHPLAFLKKGKNISDDISNLSFAQLKEITKIIREKK